MKKRLTALILAALMGLSLCACGGSKSTSAPAASAAASSGAAEEPFTLRVGMDCAYAPYCTFQSVAA